MTAKYGSAVHSLYDETTGKGLPLEADVVFSTILYYGGLFTSNEKKTPFLPNLVHAHRAFTEEEIVGFIRSVVLAENDPDKPVRDAFAAKEVCVNHPHATDAVIAELTGRSA